MICDNSHSKSTVKDSIVSVDNMLNVAVLCTVKQKYKHVHPNTAIK